jgi:cupin fold WbuC family metalloprotein
MSRQDIERISGAATVSAHQRVLAVDPFLIRLKSADASANPRQREIHVLHRGSWEPVQRMINAVQPTSYARPHRHTQPGKSETIMLLSGSLGFVTFSDDGTPLDLIHLHPTKSLAVDCREGVWHTFVALEPDTVVLEVKAGPHEAATDKEFASWAPEEGSDDAQAYLARLKEALLSR